MSCFTDSSTDTNSIMFFIFQSAIVAAGMDRYVNFSASIFVFKIH